MNEAEPTNLAAFLSLGGVSLSLINGKYEEVAFASLTSSTELWHVEIKGKWKILHRDIGTWLEEKWSNDAGHVSLEDYIEVFIF